MITFAAPRALRRTVRATAAAVAAVLVAGGLTGCAESADVVTVLGPWLGAEAAQFQRVLDGAGIRYQYEGTRTPAAALRSAVATADVPDIVVLPALGDLADFVQERKARDLRGVLGTGQAEYDPYWLVDPTSTRATPEEVYAVPVRASLKSMTWRDRTVTALAPPTWSQALAGRWCMGLGDPPNSGWPGTDWIEDILLHQRGGPALYARWAAGDLPWTAPELRAAFTTWGGVARRAPGGLPALLTQFGDAGRGLGDTGTGACAYDHQPSFILGFYRAYQPDTSRYDFSQYPPEGTGQRWSVASTDVAGLFTDSGPARDLMRYLASARGQSAWSPGDGAFSVNRKVEVADPRSVPGRVGDILRGRGDTRFCLDASDMMPQLMRDAFYAGVRDYLAHLDDASALTRILRGLEATRLASRADWYVRRPACSTDR